MQLKTNKISELKLSKPAHRALLNAGIATLKQLSKFSESEILKLHGIGKTAIPALKQALKASGLSLTKKEIFMAKTAKSVDEYLDNQNPDVKNALGKLRKAIRSAAPNAEEKISYNLPFYRQNGHLAAFVSQKNHLSFVTMSTVVIRSFKDELKNYKVSGTTIHFQALSPIPSTLVKNIIKARVKENMERESQSKTKPQLKNS